MKKLTALAILFALLLTSVAWGGKETLREIPAVRNNNPGNLVFAQQPRAVGQSKAGFAKFPTMLVGFFALKRQIRLDQQRGDTVKSFLEVYAPPYDNYHHKQYLLYLCDRLEVDPLTPLKDINRTSLARAITRFETGYEIDQLLGKE